METFYEKVALLRDRLPEATLSTDLIVGFPGETEEEFEMTMEAVRSVCFDLIYSFKYSSRPGTRAAEYPEIVEDLLSKALAFDQGMQKDKRQPVWLEYAKIPAMKPSEN